MIDNHHCQRLLDRFETWSRETASVSNDKLEICQKSAEEKFDLEENQEVSAWLANAKENVNLLNQRISERKSLLESAYARNKCLDDCQEMTISLDNKRVGISKETGDDAERTRQLLKEHDGYTTESQVLVNLAQDIDTSAANLISDTTKTNQNTDNTQQINL